LFWLIGVTNAVNMLDNMDGLASGIAAIAAAFLGFNFYLNGQVNEACMLAAFAGALIGFLIYNHNPASIFMGDCGSMFIGFFLATSALLASNSGGGRSRSVVAVLAIPVLVLVVPIFDTTFVTVMRKMSGRSASQGGRDHTSHRLVALGLTEQHAVWMLYSFAVVAGFLSLLVRHTPMDASIAAIAAFTVVMSLAGVYLGRVRVYDEAELAAARQKPVVAFLADLTYKRRVFEVMLDAVLVALAYDGAYALRFGSPVSTSQDWALFLKTLPVIVAVKLTTFLVCGVYRGLWRYASISNLLDYFRAVVLSSIASILVVVFAFRFDGFSRSVFVFDGLLLFVGVTGSRFAFRLIRRVLPAPHARSGKRVLIYGAGDGGELLVRELYNNADLMRVAVGFIDDDPRKAGKTLHGLRVHSPSKLARVCESSGAQEVLLSMASVPMGRLREIAAECDRLHIRLARLKIEIEPLGEHDLAWVEACRDTPAAIVPFGPATIKLPTATAETRPHLSR
jgi:UDP-GlcNAc:undecaprenyl-phosphate GlcNAc-1-phosphate transferase